MPLSCDCWPGCWGVHSRDWPCLLVDRDSHLLARQYLLTKDIYGSYVTMGEVEGFSELRLETDELMEDLFLHLMQVTFGSNSKYVFRKLNR